MVIVCNFGSTSNSWYQLAVPVAEERKKSKTIVLLHLLPPTRLSSNFPALVTSRTGAGTIQITASPCRVADSCTMDCLRAKIISRHLLCRTRVLWDRQLHEATVNFACMNAARCAYHDC
eukprot:2423570-Rhodomonas_salina.3